MSLSKWLHHLPIWPPLLGCSRCVQFAQFSFWALWSRWGPNSRVPWTVHISAKFMLSISCEFRKSYKNMIVYVQFIGLYAAGASNFTFFLSIFYRLHVVRHRAFSVKKMAILLAFIPLLIALGVSIRARNRRRHFFISHTLSPVLVTREWAKWRVNSYFELYWVLKKRNWLPVDYRTSPTISTKRTFCQQRKADE